MSSRTIQHRIAIDDRRESSDEGDSSYFIFSDGWTKSQSSSLYDLLWSTKTEHTGSTPENFGSLDGVRTTVHFTGTGILLRGQATCPDADPGQGTTFYYGVLDLASGGSAVSKQVTGEDTYLFNSTDLRDADHTLDLQSISPCADQPDGSSFKLSVDYALVTLGSKSTFTPSSDMLVVEPNDPFITYEGDWEAASGRQDLFGFAARETSEMGTSLLFTFFGSSIRVFGNNENPWTISVSLDNGEAREVSSFEVGTGRQVFTAEGLSDDDSAPHTLNLTVTRLPPQQSTKFRVDALMYSPTFDSLSRASELFTQWEEAGGGDGDGGGGDGGGTDPPQDEGDKSPSPVGAIAGGAIGGVVVILLLCGLIWWARRRRPAVQAGAIEDSVGGVQPVRNPGNQPVPYTKTYTDSGFVDDGSQSMAHRPSPHSPLTPYTKSYYPTSPSSTARNGAYDVEYPNPPTSATLSPYTKSYETSPCRDYAPTSPSDQRSSSQRTYPQPSQQTATSYSPISTDSPYSPLPSNGSRSPIATSPNAPSAGTSQLPMLQGNSTQSSSHPPSPSDEDPHLDTDPPPTFVSRAPGGQSEVGGEGTGSPTTTRRLMGIIDTLTQRMNEMEPPPPYGTDTGGGASPSSGRNRRR